MQISNTIITTLTGLLLAIASSGCADNEDESLPRATTPTELMVAADSLWAKAEADGVILQSLMVLQNDSVIYEDWRNGAHPDTLHQLYSVSKTFTALGVGLAINEGLLSLDERVVDIFDNLLPDSLSDNLTRMTIEHLLTMSCGHAHEPNIKRDSIYSWEKHFINHPVEYKPGTVFCYNSYGTFMLSAAIQRRSGMKLVEYLTPRLFEPLGIKDAVWEENGEGINTGGWGLWLKTEDLAKTGLMMLNGGKWHGQQIIPAEWIEQMTRRHIQSVQGTPNSLEYIPTEDDYLNSDWVQGYGYQVWRCRHNAYRADGSLGQFIIVIPDFDAVVAMTANSHTYQKEINLVWDYILPILEATKQKNM